ncbi:MAG: basic secretory family protein [Planctomycetes bacterium]|nr:basic secretory family protein [Planctomycetota bacterium]
MQRKAAGGRHETWYRIDRWNWDSYDGNYRISGNFLNWVTETYCKDIVQRLNAAARQGKYSDELWKTATGHSVQELGDEWKASLEKRIAAEKAEAAQGNETKK